MSDGPIDWSKQEISDSPVPPGGDKPARPTTNPFAAAKKFAPSKKAAAPRASKPKVTEPPSKPGEFAEDIAGFYAMVGVLVGMRGDLVCGGAIVEQSEKIGEEWDKLAEANPAVRKALRKLMKATAVGAVVAAHMPIIMAVSSHHGPGFGPRPEADSEEEAA